MLIWYRASRHGQDFRHSFSHYMHLMQQADEVALLKN